jgi:TrmH family RNA methyltransferase
VPDVTALGSLVAMELQQIGIGHPAVKDVLNILRNTAAKRFNLVVAEGLWAMKLALDLELRIDKFFFCPDLIRSEDAQATARGLVDRSRRSFEVSEKTMVRMSERGEPDGLLALVEMPAWELEQIELSKSALVLVTDGVEIPGNLGTLIRTLDGVKADLLIMTNRRTRMSHPKVFRGSQGMSLAVPHVEFEKPDEAITWLKREGFTVYLADTDESTNYRRLDYSSRTAIVVGSERYGISNPWYDHGFTRVGLPMLGNADSLNVSVSASVLLYEARAQKAGW